MFCEGTDVGRPRESNCASLIRKDAIVQQLKPIPRELDAIALKRFRISYHTCSSFPVGAPTEAKTKDLWHRIGSGLLNIFVCLVSCHICYLFVLHDILFRLNGTGRRERRSFIADEYLELACDSENYLKTEL